LETGAVSHNCCGDDAQNGEAQNSCTPLCNCLNNFTTVNIVDAGILSELMFIHNLTHTNRFTEDQTEPIFRPPEA